VYQFSIAAPIPYDHAFAQMAALRDAYLFSIFDDAALLVNCDAISEKFHGFVRGNARKPVAWKGIPIHPLRSKSTVCAPPCLHVLEIDRCLC
jgi:hypothetical protein